MRTLIYAIEQYETGMQGQTATPIRPQASPPLKWAGGKRWLVPHLKGLWSGHEHRCLVEPFVGGMSVALGLRPERALLNDFNEHVVNFYQWLQKGLEVDLQFVNDSEVYYLYRDRFNELVRAGKANSREAALYFYYLNRTGFNGLCRFNKSGGFNVPIGRYKTINYATTQDFAKYMDALAGWDFSFGDFQSVKLRDDDFVYADPPYAETFTDYAKTGFGWDDQIRAAKYLAGHAGPVVASNNATKEILELYTSLGFEVKVIEAPRMISCDGNRAKAKEMLATKGL